MIIDDEPAARYVLTKLLSHKACSVQEAVNGTEGIRMAKETMPNLIFLDLKMPDVSGFDVLDRIKTDPATPPRHGQAVATKLGNALHLVAPNLGHGVSLQGCAPEQITRFVRRASFEDLDRGCLARLPPPRFFAMPGATP